MTARIPPDVVKRIEALVASGAYPTTEDVIRVAVTNLDERVSATKDEAALKPGAEKTPKKKRTKRRDRSLEKWLADFDAWVKSHKPIGHFVDDSRDNIYE